MDKYQNRIVGFVDILGFKDLVRQTADENRPEEAKQKLTFLYNVVEYVNDFFRLAFDEIGFTDDTKVTLFSDSIVISIGKTNSYGVLSIFAALKKLQIHLIRDAILLRGGIVQGRLIHDSDILFGPALISAYNLESTSALYPRIVIDPKVLNIYSRKDGEKMSDLRIRHFDYHKTFSKDLDGFSFIDYFQDVQDYIQNGTADAYYSQVCDLIKKGIKSPDVGIRMKYMWMKEKVAPFIKRGVP